MSTSIILLDQNFSANDVDIMVFEPSVLSPAAVWGEIDDMVQLFFSLHTRLAEVLKREMKKIHFSTIVVVV